MAHKLKFLAVLFSLCGLNNSNDSSAETWKLFDSIDAFDGTRTVAISVQSASGHHVQFGSIGGSLVVRCKPPNLEVLVIADSGYFNGYFRSRYKVDDKPPSSSLFIASTSRKAAVSLGDDTAAKLISDMTGASEIAFRFDGAQVKQIDFVFHILLFEQEVAPILEACRHSGTLAK